MKIILAMIAYNNAEKCNQVIQNVIIPTINHYPNHQFEVIIADNSDKPNTFFLKHTYLFLNGNQFYAGAMNQILDNAVSDVVVYVCSNHCKMNDPTWLEDIIAPLDGAAMAGHLVDSNLGLIDLPGTDQHVQGGVFAANTRTLKSFRYTDKYPHLYSDIWLCYQMKAAGYKLASVPSIMSVWRQIVPEPQLYKLIHDESNNDSSGG